MSAARTALLLSPHLDDAAFSCGGIAARLAAGGWRVVIATAFTRSVHPAAGFALACQRDKGLDDAVDYMALRRSEDGAACRLLGAEPVWMDLPEAPHRGYDCAPALFAAPRDDDDIGAPLAEAIAGQLERFAPGLVLAPQGCGGHVDHLQLCKALLGCGHAGPLGFYRDTPYVIRNPEARPGAQVAKLGLSDLAVPLDLGAFGRKQDACGAYRSQLGFQFGGAAETAAALALLALSEGGGAGHAERLLVGEPAAMLALLA